MIVDDPIGLHLELRFDQATKGSWLGSSSRGRLLTDSLYAFCHGLPGLMYSVRTPGGSQPFLHSVGDELRTIVAG